MSRAAASRGILPYQHITQLIARGAVTADHPIEDRQIQPASLDLRLGKKAYRLISSFLPELSAISSRLNVLDFYQSDLVMYEMDLTQGAILEKGHVYLVPLLEQLDLPNTLRARANPKSTTGRLDVFTRVVTDLNVGFDEIRAGYRGPLYLEVVPRSFAIKVRTGDSLNQIRFVRGDATVSDTALQKLHGSDPLLFRNASSPKPLPPKDFRTERGLFLRIDLTGSAREDAVIGYRAKKNSHVI
ncbi:MAG: 2'-deoxycytidine 5'-triphosphate deaminase, partial [Nitrospira sp.]|nr:2'-deoxycytidine 5'-triphosphate deaminase [Nitrospira sp.]